MRRKYLIQSPLICIQVLLIFCTSCVKDNSFIEQGRYIVYVDPQPDGPTTYNLLPVNALLFRDSVVLLNKMVFPVRILNAFEQDIVLSAKIDPELIPVYDRLTNSQMPSPALPEGAFQLAHTDITIKAGMLVSGDSIQIIPDFSKIETGKTYILPVRVGTDNDHLTPPADTLRQTMFLKVSATDVTTTLVSFAGGEQVNIFNLQLVKQSDGNYIPHNDFISANVGVMAFVNSFLGKPLQVNVVAAPELTAGFNEAHQSSYVTMPGAYYNIVPPTNTIGAGLLNSNLFNLEFTSQFLPAAGNNYLIPLKIKDDAFVPPAPNSTVFIGVNVDAHTIYSRSGWTILSASSESQATGEIASNLLDGDYATQWRSAIDAVPLLPQWFIADMGQMNTVKGIMIRHAGNEGPWHPKQAKLYTSADNINWSAAQMMNIPSPSVFNENLFIDLPTPVATRYLKFEVVATQGEAPDQVSFNEFGVYGNQP
ncbi:BT_3987 domain-containing protein [Pseudobacter ginsenosidimutans]|uniref:Uncharacterized protein DUF1735 n=1 Tax=Pseudobacter ginsenosidimutans TaxID=661488 RepID=A0A4Q7MIP4_9BACT|nr:DUF1735 domain-containing protein [Pseudobacter ginsenosidimutans]QEC45601.1 DUF1735 domain-containing protein [Pseudobacter ginsenosidimutans]RZS67148.1 uncharacterized protein DUF1735 [Pseudobacter ginsenosidimutans]